MIDRTPSKEPIYKVSKFQKEKRGSRGKERVFKGIIVENFSNYGEI